MAPHEHGALRAIVLPANGVDVDEMPTRRMLGEMGHWVLPAADADEAMRLASSEAADLIVIDVSNSSANRDLVRRLAESHDPHGPRDLAVFTDQIDTRLSALAKHGEQSPRVHVFLKPLHVHGLLNLLRQIDADAECLAAH